MSVPVRPSSWTRPSWEAATRTQEEAQMRKLRFLIGPLALMVVAAACNGADVVGDDTADTGDTAEEEQPADAGAEAIRIGALHPLTGALANDGSAMNAAVQMAIEDVNEAGGIQSLGGARLELITADSQGDPEIGQTEAQRMIDEGAVAMIGAFQSAVAINVATLAERSGIPFVIDVAVDDAIITGGVSHILTVRSG
ncbi:MAG: ABC transporter substrate-binding protein [Streptosporangiales bacterium]|nr:ABC transporter substrate-binding protein [Streptosporangiales bacterium]